MVPIWAERVAGVWMETAFVVILNVEDVEPAGIVTVAGTVALVVLDSSFATAPPAGAGPLSATVAVEATPPATVPGCRVKLDNTDGLIAIVVVTEIPFAAAVIVAETWLVWVLVVTLNVVVALPASMVTVAGTTTAALLDLRVTVKPPTGADEVRLIVPTALVPPTRDCGCTEIFDSTAVSRTFETSPEKIIGPHPVTVSQPAVAFEDAPLGNVPFEPAVISKKTFESPLRE